MEFEVGDAVRAMSPVTELSFVEAGKHHIHAEIGDVGKCVDKGEDGHLVVTWTRTGSTCDVHPDEIQLVRRFPTPVYADDSDSTGRWVWERCYVCDGAGRYMEHYEDGGESVVKCVACKGMKQHLVKL